MSNEKKKMLKNYSVPKQRATKNENEKKKIKLFFHLIKKNRQLRHKKCHQKFHL